MALRPSRIASSLGATALILAVALVASASPGSPSLSDIVLRAADGRAAALASVIREQRLTVVVFFSASCPCFAAHRARLAALARDFDAQRVRVVVVDSERRASGEVSPAALAEAGLPIWRDDGARLARRLEARYATETFVFDATGALRYRGGIDGDRRYLTPAPKAFLREALTALLQANGPSFTEAKALGCALRLE
jgi:hypothetical protein